MPNSHLNNYTWGVDLDFEHTYLQDYNIIMNTSTEQRTAWIDKYTTSLFTPSHTTITRKEPQPIPDLVRWLDLCELHYMTLSDASLLEHGQWDEIPGLFLPSKILDLCYLVMPDPPENICKLIALVAWVPTRDREAYYSKMDEAVKKIVTTDQQQQIWKEHPLRVVKKISSKSARN